MAGLFALCLVLAALRFPHAYGPWQDNTLSQLGNRNLNPNGYVLYLLGCGLAGALAVAFFLSLGPWKASRTRYQQRLLLLMQALGVAGGFALFMNAVFPENDYPQHHFWAGVVFNAFAVAAIVAIPALWRPSGSNFWLIAFDVAAFGAVILMFVFAPVHWVEWLPAAMFLLFPLFLGILGAPGKIVDREAVARIPASVPSAEEKASIAAILHGDGDPSFTGVGDPGRRADRGRR
jgi:hypothetical membrane protein